MAGFQKIKSFCNWARMRSLEYAWVDTCCIDKSSSAELTEAINSMYTWYKRSALCLVYLFDMEEVRDQSRASPNDDPVNANFTSLRRCRWFRRGWTLQEFLAPRRVHFYDRHWQEIGTKDTMWRFLSLITGIQPIHLRTPSEASVAQKMSWAAGRQTTRIEDKAYCLIGLFNINMPLLYGEGDKAFMRLQHEILQSTDDESIFAWTNPRLWTSGLLAKSPNYFARSGNIVTHNYIERSPSSVTSQGLQFQIQALERPRRHRKIFDTPINCLMVEGHDVYYVILQLQQTDTGGSGGRPKVTRIRSYDFELKKCEQQPKLKHYEQQSVLVKSTALTKLSATRTHHIQWDSEADLPQDQCLSVRLAGDIEDKALRVSTYDTGATSLFITAQEPLGPEVAT